MLLVQLTMAQPSGGGGDGCACDSASGPCNCSGGNDQKCFGDNEVYGCVNPRVSCSDSCDDRAKNVPICNQPWKSSSTPAKIVCPAMACICKDGFGRDSNTGQCISADKCPANIKCGENEFYSRCKSTCYTDSCSKKDLFLRDYICDRDCDGLGGCTCEPDCARNKLGKCVKRAECEKDGKNDCGPNEEYLPCKSACLAESCADAVSSAVPPKRGAVCKTPCRQAACQCRPNCYRNIYAFNQCVPLNQCPKDDSNNNNNSDSDNAPVAAFDGVAAGGAAPGFAYGGVASPTTSRRKQHND